jgi:hypothetical protein
MPNMLQNLHEPVNAHLAEPKLKTPRLSKYQQVTLRIILLIQIIHTVLMMIEGTIIRILTPWSIMVPRQGGGWVEQALPWYQRIFWHFVLIGCFALLLELILWRSLSSLHRRSWPLITILILWLSLYLLWVFDRGIDIWPDHILSICLPVLLPFSIVTVWRSRGTFAVCSLQLILMAGAIILAAGIVFVCGRYLGMEVIDQDLPVTHYINIIGMSGFTYPQEKGLMLFLGSYGFVSMISSSISKRHRQLVR